MACYQNAKSRLLSLFPCRVGPGSRYRHNLGRWILAISQYCNSKDAHRTLLLAPEWVYPLHVNLIRHGRRICDAQKPACDTCPLYSECAYVGSVNAQETAVQ